MRRLFWLLERRIITPVYRLDDFLIDQVFQPIVYRLARYGNTYKLAAMILATAALLYGASALAFMGMSEYGIAALYAMCCLFYTATLRLSLRKTGERPRGEMPIERIVHVGTRVMGLGIGFSAMLILAETLVQKHRLDANAPSNLANLLWAVHWYVIACRNFPPPPPKPVYEFNALPSAA